jgi:acetamidase/formamidase
MTGSIVGGREGNGRVVLQPGTGPVTGQHYFPTGPGTVLWGRLPAAHDKSVLTVASGATVTFDTVSHEGILDDQGSDPVAFFGRHGVIEADVLQDAIAVTREVDRDLGDGPHVVSRPVAVEGAEPGDLIAMHVVDAVPRVPYGVISNRHGRGALPGELPRLDKTVSVFADVVERDGVLHGRLPLVEGGEPSVSFPLKPFLGIMGVAVSGAERPHSVPPGLQGGNIDIALLTAGTTLYLPVQVPGANVYVGDPHFAQGDGEVALTAMEGSLRATLRLEVVPQSTALKAFGEFAGPLAETTDYLVPTGLDADLDEAVRKCVRQAIALLGARWGVDEHIAYAYLSATTDFRISQVVDLVCGVHATIRKADFRAVPRELQDAAIVGGLDGGERGAQMLQGEALYRLGGSFAVQAYELGVLDVRLGNLLRARLQRQPDVHGSAVAQCCEYPGELAVAVGPAKDRVEIAVEINPGGQVRLGLHLSWRVPRRGRTAQR